MDILSFKMGKKSGQAEGASGTIDITENGEHDVSSYAKANINVLPSGTLEVTENGTYDVTDYSTAEVNVPIKPSWSEVAVLCGADTSVVTFADYTEKDKRAIMTTKASVDFLVECLNGDFASDFVTEITSSEKGMKWVGISQYACAKFMAVESFRTAAEASSYADDVSYWETADESDIERYQTRTYLYERGAKIYGDIYDSAPETDSIVESDRMIILRGEQTSSLSNARVYQAPMTDLGKFNTLHVLITVTAWQAPVSWGGYPSYADIGIKKTNFVYSEGALALTEVVASTVKETSTTIPTENVNQHYELDISNVNITEGYSYGICMYRGNNFKAYIQLHEMWLE